MGDQIDGLIDELTLAEKVSLTHGAVDPDGRATGYIPGVERLDIPPLGMVDGPLGVRIPGESSTAFPAPLALAATFDVDLATEFGTALGRETRGKGQDVLLAPGVNLIRVPNNGRNFEYFSEDPVHAAAFSAAVVEGIQSMDVIATPKHYVANNQERERASIDVQVGERALRELYLPAFEAAVDVGAGSVMTAYNTVNGTRMSDHDRLINTVLKGEFGFEGYTVSDWFGTESASAAVNGGLDVEMPGISMEEMVAPMAEDDGEASADDGGVEAPTDAMSDDEEEGETMPEEVANGMPDPETCERFAETLADAVEAGEVPEERLDDAVSRVLGQMDRVGMFDGDRVEGDVDTDAHRDLTERVAARGTVLLENDGILPIEEDADVALIGPNVDEAILGGGGSSETSPVVESVPADAVAERADGDVDVVRGLPRVVGVSLMDYLSGDTDLEPDGEVAIDAATDAATDAEVAVVLARDVATEALDRESLSLPDRQDELIEAVADANDRTVVVLNTSGPVETPWREDVAAIVENWYPGQAHGDAIAAVLYGDHDPAGRLPVTFAPEATYPTADERRFPGVDGQVHYDEGVFVGYRHFDRIESQPTYPFGHGLSYADFEYVDASIDGETATVTIENVAERDGREVVQAYVRPPAIDGIDRPERELAGFAAIEVPAGERVTAEIDLGSRAFARYDDGDGWTVDSGEYVVEIGRSARDSRLERSIER
ncbi:beta-glucosidase [Halorhabdus amylolytica]|uniref:beta-glucosidase n=1 Tax=Halorhabdus amylolytica TaxID=2559573 RepID=UPI0010A9D512|nr:glycoside hydrolase family 3 C-terminal domain-containing protein [Halorhabdus amylolytica]